jgi:hypothetical protein
MSEQELKPCPFCGGSDLKVWDNAVECHVCEASWPDLGHCVGPECKAQTIMAWNTRAPDTENAELAARVKELEGNLKSCEHLLTMAELFFKAVDEYNLAMSGKHKIDFPAFRDEVVRLRSALAKKDALKPCRCGQPATTSFDGEILCEACAREDAHRDLEEQEMPGGFGEG